MVLGSVYIHCYALILSYIVYFSITRTFVATASRIVRPNTIYKVNVAVLPDSPDLIVKAYITKGSGHQIASVVEIVDSGTSNNLLLPVIINKQFEYLISS